MDWYGFVGFKDEMIMDPTRLQGLEIRVRKGKSWIDCSRRRSYNT